MALAQEGGHFRHGWLNMLSNLGVGRTEIVQIRTAAFGRHKAVLGTAATTIGQEAAA